MRGLYSLLSPMRSHAPRRRYVRRSRLYWFVRRYGFVVVALVVLAFVQLVGTGVVTVDENAPAGLGVLANVEWVVPQY